MWRRTSLVVLIVLNSHISSQPITEDSHNERPTRQLDFGECCPCAEVGNTELRSDGYKEPMAAGTEGVFAAARDVDDCPCRFRDADPQGASSVFFPTAMRAAGSFLRPSDKKEELKPIFNPEVDLASSVLQTLREATDEEYEDALARDAAKSAAKAAESILFGDATPEESANIVTIVVNPKVSDDYDDVIPQASHIQKARCIHPMPTARASLDRPRVAPKSNLIIHKHRLPKVRHSKLLHRNLYEMDSGVGASNVHEQRVPIDEDVNDSRSHSSSMKAKTTTKSASNINPLDDCDRNKVPELRSASVLDKLKDFDLSRSSLLQTIRDKFPSPLTRIPKFRSGSLLKDNTMNNNEDLSHQPSTIYEESAKRVPNLLLGGLKHKAPSLSLPNLLNLKDVELVPLKELINKHTARTTDTNDDQKLIWTSKPLDNSGVTTMREVDDSETFNIIESDMNDPEGSPSLINIQVNPKDTASFDENCEESGSDPEVDFNEKENDLNSMQGQVTEDDCEEGASENNDTNFKEADTSILSADDNPETSTNDDCDEGASEFVFDTKPKESVTDVNETEDISLNKQANGQSSEDTDCVNDENKDHLVTDSSNNSNGVQEEVFRQNEDENVEAGNVGDVGPSKIGDQENQIIDSSQDIDKRPKLFDALPVDKTLTTIKEHIAKKIEDLKNFKTNVKNLNIFNSETASNDVESKHDSEAKSVSEDSDCQNEASEHISTQLSSDNLEEFVTTLKPDFIENNLEDVITTAKPDLTNDNAKDASEISLQDLQNMSDSMLQQEVERERESKILECDKSAAESISENNRNYADFLVSDQPAEEKIGCVEKNANLDNVQLKNVEEQACKSDFGLQKTVSETDSNFEASGVVNQIAEPSVTLGSQPILEPSPNHLNPLTKPLSGLSDVLKLPRLEPLPSLDDIKVKLTTMFDKSNRDTEDITPSETKPGSQTLDLFKPVMATDASTSSFLSRLPPSKILKDVNLDFMDLKSRSSKQPALPTLGLPSYRTKLSSPKNLSLNPIKLRPTLQDKGSNLGKTIEGKSNIWKSDKTNIRKNQKAHSRVSSDIPRPRLKETRKPLMDSPLQATNDFHSRLLNTRKAIESRFREVVDNIDIFRNPIKNPSYILENISRHHGRNNDRITMAPRKPPSQKRVNMNSRSNKEQQRKLRMPAAASVPVPKTVKVPELKTTSVNSSPLNLRTAPIIKPITSNTGPSQQIESSRSLGNPTALQNSNLILGKKLNQKKESTIKVSFATSPRPVIQSGDKFKDSTPRSTRNKEDLGKSRPGKLYERQNESPSEARHLKISASSPNRENRLRYSSPINEKSNTRMIIDFGTKSLQTRPILHESPLLTKFREAVETKLNNGHIQPLKLANTQSVGRSQSIAKELTDNMSNNNLKLDMARAPSETSVIVHEQALKENVPYKCKMVCTHE
ncbi:uncharacterized protein LOC142981428 [Anticarsia gemmatalis]|uniref:uncharacterized protein LOC142981428 n=1 Tax=Anticarsia gemmatalis TaxID=129554 RepID=UPI003F76155F